MPQGSVIVIGGAEDKVRDRVILSRFVTLAGGPRASVAVISTASSLGLEAGERYRAVFAELGVRDGPADPCGDPPAGQRGVRGRAPCKDATGIFLTGGNQLRLSSTLGGHPPRRRDHGRASSKAR